MISPLAYEMAKARTAELQRSGASRVALRSPDRTAVLTPRPRPARQRAGWWLVTVGLRLATGSADALR